VANAAVYTYSGHVCYCHRYKDAGRERNATAKSAVDFRRGVTFGALYSQG